MKAKLLFLLKYYLFWIGLSVVAKLIFLFYQWQDTTTLSGNDIGQIIWKGLQLDFSLGGYIMMLSCLVLALSSFLGGRIVRMVFSVITILCLAFFAIVMTIDLELFRNWGYHMDTTPLMYLKTPKEAMASTPLWLILCLLLLMTAFFFGGWWIFQHYIRQGLDYNKGQYWGIPLFLILGGLMIIPVRGGFNVAPMNSSFVFFHSKNMYANQAAINPVWNFIYELMHVKKLGQHYSFMPEEQAREIIRQAEQTNGVYPR